MSPKFKDISIRTLSGILLLIVVLGAVILSEYTFLLLMVVICVGIMQEFFRLAESGGKTEPQKLYATIVSVATLVACFYMARGTIGYKWIAVIMSAVMLLFAIELFRMRKTPMLNIGVSLGGIIYGAMPLILMSFIVFANGTYDPYIILSCIFIVWMNDIFAYLTGVSIGSHKMHEKISPKKTWEGFFGGLVFAVAFAVLCGHLMGDNLWKWAGLGIVISISSVLGDFIESMLKREAGVKDSGSVLPGHGGFMDRFDALVYSIPFVFTYLRIFGY